MRALRLPSLATLRAFRPTRRQLIGIGIAILVSGAWLLAGGPAGPDNSLVARVKRGPFAVTVTPSGELRARQFVQITAPLSPARCHALRFRCGTADSRVIIRRARAADLPVSVRPLSLIAASVPNHARKGLGLK